MPQKNGVRSYGKRKTVILSSSLSRKKILKLFLEANCYTFASPFSIAVVSALRIGARFSTSATFLVTAAS